MGSTLLTSSNLNQLPKGPTSNTIPFGGRVSTWILGRCKHSVHNKGPLVTLAKLYLCTAAVLGTGLHRWTQVWGSDKLPWKLITHHPKEIPTWDLDFPGCFAAAPEGLRLVWSELEPAYTNWQYRCSGSPGAQVVSGWAFPLCGASQNETNWNKSVLKQSIENTQIDMCEFDSNSTIC